MENTSQKLDYLVDTKLKITTRFAQGLEDIISFTGSPQNYCIGLVDLVNSSNVTSELSYKKAGMYYSIFLNMMSLIVKTSGGKVVKNIGDSLLYYFPSTLHSSHRNDFHEALDCGFRMLEARTDINQKMIELNLPKLNYRISFDFGCVMVADTKTSFNKDLFGSPVNICSKINSLAKPNEIVIGEKLYQIVKNQKKFEFKKNQSYYHGENIYPIYKIKQKTNHYRSN